MGYAHSEETLMFHTLSLGRRGEGKPLEEAELDNDMYPQLSEHTSMEKMRE